MWTAFLSALSAHRRARERSLKHLRIMGQGHALNVIPTELGERSFKKAQRKICYLLGLMRQRTGKFSKIAVSNCKCVT